MSAQLEIPDDFELMTSPSPPHEGKGMQRRVRRDRAARGMTHRVPIGDLVQSSQPAVAPATATPAEADTAERKTLVFSSPNDLGEREKIMTPSNKRESKLVREIVVRTLPVALFLVLMVWVIGIDEDRVTARAIIFIAGIILVPLTLYLWFPRDEHQQGKTDVRSREKLS